MDFTTMTPEDAESIAIDEAVADDQDRRAAECFWCAQERPEHRVRRRFLDRGWERTAWFHASCWTAFEASLGATGWAFTPALETEPTTIEQVPW